MNLFPRFLGSWYKSTQKLDSPNAIIFPKHLWTHSANTCHSFTHSLFSHPKVILSAPCATCIPWIQGQHTWKKNRTIKTCNPAMQTIIKLSITLKLKILLSVLLTVLKFRFSLVRKYFWFLVIVESWPEILKIDSSNAEVCSGDVPCFEGIEARSSFSTWTWGIWS